jgi:hypothetical protein
MKNTIKLRSQKSGWLCTEKSIASEHTGFLVLQTPNSLALINYLLNGKICNFSNVGLKPVKQATLRNPAGSMAHNP